MAIGLQRQAKLSDEILDGVGTDFSSLIIDVREARNRRMMDVWAKAHDNYEGVAEEVNFPWPRSSNAVVPVTRAHTDAWKSRLYNAGTGQDPMFQTSGWGADELFPGFRVEEYADLFQEYSVWAEKEEVPVQSWMEAATTLITKYGNAIAYVTWEHEWVMDVEVSADGKEVIKTRRDLFNKPVVHMLHPQNFYMPVRETDLQTAPWCGFDVEYTPDQIRTNIALGEFRKKQAELVLKWHKEKTLSEIKKDKGNKGYFRRTEDGKELPTHEYDRVMQKVLATRDPYDKHTIHFVRVFARIDTDGDAIPEEMEFLLHVESRQIVQIYNNRYKHKKRPLVLFSFLWREGTWLHAGVPEIIFNGQRILNELIRDLLNNNKVRNSSVFIGRSGGVIQPDEPIFPGRVILTEDIERDFKILPMASGTMTTTIQDLSYVQSWVERADGMSDANLGRETRSRTPATTMLALLEEGSERVVSTVHRLRVAQGEVWTQVHQLYAQNGDASGLDRVLGKDKAARLRAAWQAMSVEDIRRKLVLDARVSTANLNRAVKRTENVALVAQLDQFHQRTISLAQLVMGTTNPVLRAMAISMLKAGEVMMDRILSTYDIKYKDEMNPALSHALEQMPPSLPPAAPIPGGELNPQVAQGLNQQPNQPLNAPGRPSAGLPRLDGGGG